MKSLLLFNLCNLLTIVYSNLEEASVCVDSSCKIANNCRCASNKNPVTSDVSPQLIGLTVSESVVAILFENYWKPLLFNRKNPDGQSVSATFFVPHEYTDYSLVQQLYLNGFEIADHSITKTASQEYWRSASLDTLIDEFSGQREILSHFANIPIADIVGGRTPQLQLEGDVSIEAYNKSGLIYDNSWPTLTNQPVFPYTLDYASTQKCTTAVMTCPKESHKGFWIVPLSDIHGNNTECNSLATCDEQGSADDIANWLINEVNFIRNKNKTPIVLRLDSYWFEFNANSYQGFTKFLDKVAQLDDVFLVSVGQIIEWIKNPVPVSEFKTKTYNRTGSCVNINCRLDHFNGDIRYMKSCVSCPNVYPWLGNPLGD